MIDNNNPTINLIQFQIQNLQIIRFYLYLILTYVTYVYLCWCLFDFNMYVVIYIEGYVIDTIGKSNILHTLVYLKYYILNIYFGPKKLPIMSTCKGKVLLFKLKYILHKNNYSIILSYIILNPSEKGKI